MGRQLALASLMVLVISSGTAAAKTGPIDPIPAAKIGSEWQHIYSKLAAKSHIAIINVKQCHWYPVPSIGQRIVSCVAILQSTLPDHAVSCWVVAIGDQGQGLQAQRVICHRQDLALGKQLASGPAT